MPREIPFFIEGNVTNITNGCQSVLVRVQNGNVYSIHPDTPGIDFKNLREGQIVRLEITTRLIHVLSAYIVNKE
jgi:hypothetical protein